MANGLRPFALDRNIRHFLWYGGVAGDGLRSVEEEAPLLIQERLLYPAPRSPFTGRGGVEHANPGPPPRVCGLSVTMPGGGTCPGEEVRDGSHGDNRCGGNRGGVAPTAAPLRPPAGTLRRSGHYTGLGRAF
jgi:hypothetical protein